MRIKEIYNLSKKDEQTKYAKFLILRFGGVVGAACCVDEMLKVSVGHDTLNLNEVRKRIFEK